MKTLGKLAVHELCKRLPAQSPEERSILKKNMVQRAKLGLDPLESPILLLDDQIIDGRLRFELWQELAEEGECEGYFELFPPKTEGALEELETLFDEIEDDLDEDKKRRALILRLHSRNLCHRSLTAEQKAAQLLLDIEEIPELRAFVEQIEAKNQALMKAGEKNSLGSTNVQLGKMIGVSDGTIKNAKRLTVEQQKAVASGEKTAKQILGEMGKNNPSKNEIRPFEDAITGDTVLTILPFENADILFQAERITEVDGDGYLLESGKRIKKKDAYIEREALRQRKRLLQAEIKRIQASIDREAKILPPPSPPSPPPPLPPSVILKISE